MHFDQYPLINVWAAKNTPLLDLFWSNFDIWYNKYLKKANLSKKQQYQQKAEVLHFLYICGSTKLFDEKFFLLLNIGYFYFHFTLKIIWKTEKSVNKIILAWLMAPTKQKCQKLATEGQNTQPTHHSVGNTPENLPVEEEREKQAEMKKMVKNR